MSTDTRSFEYRFGGFAFRSDLMELRGPDGQVAVERRPLEILLVLLENANEVVGKDEILDRVWPDTYTVDNVVANAVAKLRKALGDEYAKRIVTHPRIGYRFTGDVERVAAGRKLYSSLELKTGDGAPLRPHFKLEEQLSGGPAREVWRARHTKTGEKRIFKYARDGAGLASIKREITVFRLAHAHGKKAPLVRLIDWNLSSEPFFLESEDAGDTLDTVMKRSEFGAALDQRIALVADIADAIDRIHRLGAVHGDIKPSNICVGGNGDIGLIDFGSARLLDLAPLEQLGVTPLGMTRTVEGLEATPIYLAPERLSGSPASPAADVYSLGVLLYQAVTQDFGAPLPSDWRSHVECAVLRSDIEETTRSDPSERPTSAGALATRLRDLEARRERQIEAEHAVVRARQAEEMLRETRARRPWLISTGAVLAAGLAFTAFFAVAANRSAGEARERTEELAATNDFLSAMMRAGDPRTPGPGADSSVRELVGHARTMLDQPRFSGPGLQIQLREVLADIHVGLALHENEVSLREDLVSRLDQAGFDAGHRARAYFELAEAYMRASRFGDALAAVDQGELIASGSEDAQVLIALASTRGRYHLTRLEYEAAASLYEEALDLIEALPSPDLGVYHAALQDLSQSYSRLNRHDEAIALMEDALAPPFADGGVPDFRLAGATRLLGAAYVHARRPEEAEPLLLEASRQLRSIYGDASTQAQEADNDLAVLYSDLGRWSEAARLLDRLRSLNCEQYGARHMRCLAYSGNAGVTMIEAGDFMTARSVIGAAHEGFASILGKDAAPTQLMAYHLANAYLETGDPVRAGELVVALDESSLTAASPSSRWDLYLPLIRTRIMLNTGQGALGQTTNQLRELVEELSQVDPDLSVLARARADLENVVTD